MNELKERIPNEVALREVVDALGPELVTAVRAEVGDIESAYSRFRSQRNRFVIFFILFIVLVPFIGPFLALSAVVWIPTGLYVSYRYVWPWWRQGSELAQRFHAGVNGVLFSRTLAVVGLQGALKEYSGSSLDISSLQRGELSISGGSLVVKNSELTDLVLALLAKSELITEPFNTTNLDNIVEATHDDSPILVAELDAKNVTGSGKNRQVKNIFHGYFVSFDLTRTLEAKTFVSTEGDEQGFGHRSFWGSRSGTELRETILEWNEFENLLHVATTNEVEARYVLTTNFMHDLYEWWKDKKVNIRLSFIENRLYILFPDAAIRFHDTVPKIEEKALTDYLYTIAKPLMHVVHLVEDVKL